MAIERTLSIVKPDAVAKNVIGEIYSRFEKAGLKIIAARMKLLTVEDARRKQAESAPAAKFQNIEAVRCQPLGLTGQRITIAFSELSFLRAIKEHPALLPEADRFGPERGDGLPIKPAFVVHEHDQSIKPGQQCHGHVAIKVGTLRREIRQVEQRHVR